MTGAWAIAMREIGERRSVLATALLAGMLPFASPLLPGVRSDQWAEARDVGALVVATAFGMGCALLLGASVIGRDLAERRLSFDFARPLGAWGIWTGRLLGALGLSILVLGLALLPATAVGGGLLSGPTLRFGALALVAGMLVLVPLAHVASIAMRSRTAWLVVDLVCAVVFACLVGVSGRFLFDAFAFRLLAGALLVLVALAVPALWIASAAQVVVGRTDLRRGHKAQSLTLWGILFGLGLGFAGFVGWVFAIDPSDLTKVHAEAAPRGNWLVVSGAARGRADYHPLFLVSADGQSVRIGSAPPSGTARSVLFSQDGRRGVVFRRESPQVLRIQVGVVDLARAQKGVRETTLVLADPWATPALSADGTRLAVLDERVLSVVDLDSGATLVAVQLDERPDGTSRRLFFTTGDRVRLVQLGERMTIDELDIPGRKFERTGVVEDTDVRWRLQWDPNQDRYLLGGWARSDDATLLDGRSGSTIRELPCGFENGCSWQFLADGRILEFEQGGERPDLRLLSAAGNEIRRLQAPTGGPISVDKEIAPGEVVVTLRPLDTWQAWIADLDTGRWREIPEDLTPLGPFASWWDFRTPEAGSLAAKLFRSGNAIVLFDPTTNERRTLAGPG